jgi:hypothetical protein
MAKNGEISSEGYQWIYLDNKSFLNEEWRLVTIDTTTIEVSSYGRVKHKNGRITFGSEKDGYMEVSVAYRSLKVHRLVCLAFNWVEGYEYLDVNHKDENKKNNRPQNLEFVTRKENKRHSSAKPVNQYTLDGKFIQKFECVTDTKKVGVDPGDVVKVCKGKEKTAGGFIRSYADRDEK